MHWTRRKLQPNPLADSTWGVEPPSARHRTLAYAAVFWPICVYAALFVLLMFGLIAAGMWGRVGALPLSQKCAISSMMSGTILWPMILIVQSCQGAPALRLKSNWQDYYLAGISGHQMLRALSAPRIVGIMLLALAYSALYFPSVLTVISDSVAGGSYLHEQKFIILTFGAAQVFSMFMITTAIVTAWLPHPSIISRIFIGLLAGFVSSPLLILIDGVVSGYVTSSPTTGELNVVATAEMLSWPLRIAYVRRRWRKAVRYLNAGGDVG